MALESPKFTQAQCVLTFTAPYLRERSRDEVVVAALSAEFPNVISMPMGESVARNAPLVLASGSAQLSIGPGQAEFGVGFFGDYVTSLEGAIEYLRTKLGTVVSALNGIGVHVLVAGVVLIAQFSFGTDIEAVRRKLLETQIRHDVPPDDIADVQVRLALKVSDTYFVSLIVSNYESRNFRGVASPATPVISVRPWEGEVTDVGIQLIVDVNNRPEVQQADRDKAVDEARLAEILEVLRAVAADSGPKFVATGEVSSADIQDTLGGAE